MIENKAEIVIFGYTKVAKEVANILKDKKLDFLFVQDNKADYEKTIKDGFDVLELDLMKDDSLMRVGVSNWLKTLYVFHKTDSINLFVTISARNLDSNLNIITLTENPQDKKKMSLAGANRTISPYEIGAHRAYRMLKHPNIIDIIDNALYNNSDISIYEIEVKKDSPISGKYTKQIYLSKEYNLVVIGIKDKEISEDFIFYSAGINHKIDCGDIIVVIGHLEDVERFKQEMI
jgi:voltage-gated potassium channel